MPGPNLLPGVKGTDYHLVRGPNGAVYAVYRVRLPNGRWINTTWRVEKSQYKALNIDPDKVRRIGRQAFNNLNVFGTADEIVRRGGHDKHPFQSYIQHLSELHHGTSWLQDKQFMSIMLMGWAENWTAAELQQRLSNTKWYESRTDAQRDWELNKSAEQRQAEITSTRSRVTEALQDLYGPNISLDDAGVTDEEIGRIAKKIASGSFGSPADGFEAWFERARNRAERVEGSAAWIERQQEIEAARAFQNRPEDVFEQIRQEAFQWLGPQGRPDNDTLRRWSQDLVSEVKSDGDWQRFLRNQAKNLYPWLGPEEMWQDRAGMYKRIAEEQYGTPIDWDDPILGTLGEQDANGAFTGNALSFDAYTKQLRNTDRWWGTKMAQDEGFQLVNYLNNTFNGVTA